MNIVFSIIATFAAALFFGMQLSAPKRAVVISAILGLVGYFVFFICNEYTDNEYLAAFLGTLAACFPAEIFARIIKTPATVIIFISVIPLVPGVMIYQSMLFFAQNDFTEGSYQIMRTFIYSGAMAIAITISTILGKQLLAPIFKKIREKKHTNKA